MLFGHAEEVVFKSRVAAENNLRVGPGKLCEAALKDRILRPRPLDRGEVPVFVCFPYSFDDRRRYRFRQ